MFILKRVISVFLGSVLQALGVLSCSSANPKQTLHVLKLDSITNVPGPGRLGFGLRGGRGSVVGGWGARSYYDVYGGTENDKPCGGC